MRIGNLKFNFDQRLSVSMFQWSCGQVFVDLAMFGGGDILGVYNRGVLVTTSPKHSLKSALSPTPPRSSRVFPSIDLMATSAYQNIEVVKSWDTARHHGKQKHHRNLDELLWFTCLMIPQAYLHFLGEWPYISDSPRTEGTEQKASCLFSYSINA